MNGKDTLVIHSIEALKLLEQCLYGVACECTDPPEERESDDERGTDPDNPSCHAQYCPEYLRAVITSGLTGEGFPD